MRIFFVLFFCVAFAHAESADFMQRAKDRTKDLLEQILKHPFLLQLAKGTLSRDRFDRYRVQDNIYCWRYADPLNLLAEKTLDESDKLFFMKGAKDSTQEWGGSLRRRLSRAQLVRLVLILN